MAAFQIFLPKHSIHVNMKNSYYSPAESKFLAFSYHHKVQSRFSYFNLLGFKVSVHAEKKVFVFLNVSPAVGEECGGCLFCLALEVRPWLAAHRIILHFRVSTPVCNL